MHGKHKSSGASPHMLSMYLGSLSQDVGTLPMSVGNVSDRAGVMGADEVWFVDTFARYICKMSTTLDTTVELRTHQ